jgi:hypothetical protein
MRIVATSGEQSSAARPERLPVPTPREAIQIRPGTMADLSFVDALQKRHTKMVGWMPTGTLEGKIRAGHVLIAEEAGGGQQAAGSEAEEAGSRQRAAGSAEESGISLPAAGCQLPADLPSLPAAGCQLPAVPIGYCIGNDQYFKRDDLGIIYQMNVVPGKQRALVGATLLKAMFERAAWGCKLYCCWCAQDIAANRFWEAMGFVALAFRTGSRRRGPNGSARVHIFWQRRIRSGDTTTPYWFPAQTSSGAIGEDRLVLPIPPGTHWSDAKPIVLPGAEKRQLENKPPRVRAAKVKGPVVPKGAIVGGGLRFGSAVAPVSAGGELAMVETPKREARKKEKNHPRLVAAARELRDRWMEQVNADPAALLSEGKYDVSRALIDARVTAPATDREPHIVDEAPALPAPIAA